MNMAAPLRTFLLTLLAVSSLPAQQLIWSSTENGQIWTADLAGGSASLFVDIRAETGNANHEPRKLAYSQTNRRIYWTENSLGNAGIFSMKRDGSDIQTVVDIPAVFGAAEYFTEGLTTVGNKIYWTDTARKKIYHAALDGAGAAVLIDGTDGSINDATGITSDGTSLYWCDRGFEAIYKANLDGSQPRQIIDVAQETGDNFFGTWDVVFAGGKIYWTGVFGPAVYSANPDGTQVTPVLANAGTIGATRPFGITEYMGTIYFGDSEQSTTAIYSVGTGGQNPGRLVKGTNDDRYPLVLPPDSTGPQVTPPVITRLVYNPTTGLLEISILGDSATDYEILQSSSLDFGPGGDAAKILVSGPGSAPLLLTTDENGVASATITLDNSKPRNFVRLQTAE